MATRLGEVLVAIRVLLVDFSQHVGELVESDVRLVNNVGVDACRDDDAVVLKTLGNLQEQVRHKGR